MHGALTWPSDPPELLDGRYDVGARIGTGGQAAVFEGVQLSTGRPVAIKVANDARPNAVARLRREAQHLARVDHPAVLSIFDSGTTPDGRPYLVVERMCGRTLHDEIDRKPMPAVRAVRLALGALDGLEAVHRAGLVHRDVKPENLFLCDPGTPQERLVLFDFGIAVSLTDARLTRAGDLVGTPQYLAPEMSQGSGSPAIDVYQMALVLTEMLTGEALCEGSAAECIRQHQAGVKLPYGLPRPLAGVLEVALRSDPDGRFATAAKLRDALAETLRPKGAAGLWTALGVVAIGLLALFGVAAIVAGTLGAGFVAREAPAGPAPVVVAVPEPLPEPLPEAVVAAPDPPVEVVRQPRIGRPPVAVEVPAPDPPKVEPAPELALPTEPPQLPLFR